MSTTGTRGVFAAVIATVIGALAIGGTAAAYAAGAGDHHAGNTALADDFNGVDRNTNWQLTGKLKLNFPTFHTEGIAFTPDHIFLSTVCLLYTSPSPRDRTRSRM